MDDGKQPLPRAEEVRVAGNGPVWAPGVGLVWIVTTLISGLSGPFGTYDAYGLLVRLVFWGLLFAVGIAATFSWRFLLRRTFGQGRQALQDAIGLAGAILIVWALASVAFSLFSAFERVPPVEGRALLGNVALVVAVIYLVRRSWPGLEDPRYALVLDSLLHRPVKIRPALAERLPDDCADILRLEADGHFVVVFTDSGSHRLRLRLADAIEEMRGVPGVCSHRSHWVVIDAVEAAVRVEGKAMLRITGGYLIPISRKYYSDVEAAGLLRDLP